MQERAEKESIDTMARDLSETIEAFWFRQLGSIRSASDNANNKREQEALNELVRLAKVGAAVEAMPPGCCLEREGWSEQAWNVHNGTKESSLCKTAQDALDWLICA